jgi:hypothetical protein
LRYANLAKNFSPRILGYREPRRLLIIDFAAKYNKVLIHRRCDVAHNVARRPIRERLRNYHAAIAPSRTHDRDAFHKCVLDHVELMIRQKSDYMPLRFGESWVLRHVNYCAWARNSSIISLSLVNSKTRPSRLNGPRSRTTDRCPRENFPAFHSSSSSER